MVLLRAQGVCVRGNLVPFCKCFPSPFVIWSMDQPVSIFSLVLMPWHCFNFREHAPSIIFMDEIDSIGSARMESGSGNGDSEVQRTMLELLNQLDGFEASNKIKASSACCFNCILLGYNFIDVSGWS